MTAAPAQEGRGISPYTWQYVLAVHEAGHAIAAYLVGSHEVESITLRAFEENGLEIFGRVSFVRPLTIPPGLTSEEATLLAEWVVRNAVGVALAGPAFVMTWLGDIYQEGNLTDYEQAHKCALYITGETDEDDKRAFTILEEWQWAFTIAREYRAVIESVVTELLETEILSGDEFAAIMTAHGYRRGALVA